MKFLVYGLVSVLSSLVLTAPLQARELHLDRIKLPPGFKITLYQGDVPGARSLASGPGGIVFVGTREEGKVYALKDGRAHVIAKGLEMPNGVAFRDGALYVAEISRILRFDGIEKKLANPPKPKVVYDKFPKEKHHGWKFIAFGPDGWLYVPVGAPCNICERRDDERFASITRLKPDGSEVEVYARGVRNSVGFDWRPGTNELWFTDNGRDMLGEDLPPDELNRATAKGLHFGYPYCHGGDIGDPEFGSKRPCSDFEKPVQRLGAHVAALGMRFYDGKMFPKEYRGQILVAEHGSWNRAKKAGYRVAMVKVENGKAVKYQAFAEGWKQGEEIWGRPVDLLVQPDGAILVSDDYAGAIYRITYETKR